MSCSSWCRLKNNDKRAIISDDEYERLSNTSQTSMKGDEAFAKRKAGMQKNELNEQLKEYISQWRDERTKEEAELKRLKEKQAKKKEEEEKIRKEEAEKKAAEAEEKKKRMEEAEIKRQEMMAAQKEKGGKSSAPAMDARKELSKSKEQVEEE